MRDSAPADPSALGDLRWRGRGWVSAGRRAVLSLMAVGVVLAGLGFLGVHRRSVSASADGITLTVVYPGVARPGLDVPLQVTVTSDHGFGDDITLGIDRRYLGMFESQGMFPDDSDATSLGRDTVLLTYSAPPSGDTLVVDFDVYVQPGSQIGSTGTVSVMNHATPAVTVHFSTFLFP